MAKISKVRLLQIIIFLAFGIDSSKNSSYCLSPLFVLTTLIPALHIVKWHLGKLHPLTFQFLVDLDQQGAPPGNSSSASDVTAGTAPKSPGPTPLVLAVLSAVIIVAAVVNLSIRVAIIFLHKKIRHLCHEFKKLNSTRTFSQWSHNELGLAIIIVLSCMLRYSTLIGDFVEKINHSSDRTAWNLTASCFYMHIREIYGGELQIEVINLVFVCLIVSIAKNMREHSPESQLRSLGISDSLLPRHLLRRERLRLLTNKYLTWMKFWRNANDALGFIFVCLFVQLFLTLSFTTFIFITASIDMSFYHPVAVRRFVQSSLIFGKILCLGNAAHELKMTVGLARVNNASQLFNEMSLLAFMRGREVETVVTLKNHLGACDVISRLAATHDRNFELSAMKFFTVSRDTLTSFAGVLVTYLVALLQFQISGKCNTTSNS